MLQNSPVWTPGYPPYVSAFVSVLWAWKNKQDSPAALVEGHSLALNMLFGIHQHLRVPKWEGLEAGGEGDDRGWDGWMASQTRWAWVWVNSGSWWWTGRPGMLRFMGSQSRTQLSNWTELNWTEVSTIVLNKLWAHGYEKTEHSSTYSCKLSMPLMDLQTLFLN